MTVSTTTPANYVGPSTAKVLPVAFRLLPRRARRGVPARCGRHLSCERRGEVATGDDRRKLIPGFRRRDGALTIGRESLAQALGAAAVLRQKNGGLGEAPPRDALTDGEQGPARDRPLALAAAFRRVVHGKRNEPRPSREGYRGGVEKRIREPLNASRNMATSFTRATPICGGCSVQPPPAGPETQGKGPLGCRSREKKKGRVTRPFGTCWAELFSIHWFGLPTRHVLGSSLGARHRPLRLLQAPLTL